MKGHATNAPALTGAELERAAELADATADRLREQFKHADELGAHYRAAGYESVGRLVRRREPAA